MNRRTFLGFGLSVGAMAVLSACNKFIGASPEHMSGHDMSSMGSMHGMHGGGAALLPVDAIASGAPLAALVQLKNSSSQAGLFQAQLTAKESRIELVKGKPTTFWTYNDQVPGPQITVNEGDRVEISFKNTLKQPTTIHWHGLPVAPEQDGNPHDPVQPGQSHTYAFTLPIGSAGTYWYHTHAHGLAAEQAFRGLAGSFVVKAANDPLAHLPEQHLLFSDLRLDTDAQIPANDMMDWMNGREGQFVLCNAQRQPKITITGTQRLRIWNACSARYLNLSLPNCEFIVVGTDGGLLESPAPAMSTLLIAPAERYEVVVRAKQSGSFPLQSQPYDRHKMMAEFKAETTVLAQVSIEAIEPQLPAQLRSIAELGPVQTHKTVEFSEMPMNQIMGQMQGMGGTGGMQHNTHNMDGMSQSQMMMSGMFYVNGKSFDMARVDLTSQVNQVEEWLISNNSHMDHPFHIHGAQFQIIEHRLAGSNTPPPYRAWKDTVNLRPNEQVRIHIKQTFKGMRMFHCHILEHEAVGMMAQLMVV